MCSEDGLSSGGEFYDDDNVEFRRPAPDIVIKSVPIVPSQQVNMSSHYSHSTVQLIPCPSLTVCENVSKDQKDLHLYIVSLSCLYSPVYCG